jgi:hypothetical protein
VDAQVAKGSTSSNSPLSATVRIENILDRYEMATQEDISTDTVIQTGQKSFTSFHLHSVD